MNLAIVQARITSTRLPGKSVKQVLGKPLIVYLLERLESCQHIDKIVVAIPDNEENTPLAQYIPTLGFDVFKGSEDNVLERFYLAAKKYNPDNIVRITADCPLIDPIICDRLISVFSANNADYAYLSQKFAEGLDVEVIKFTALEKAYQDAQLKSEYEHVTHYVYSRPEKFTHFVLENETDDSQYRFTVDEPCDFDVVKAIIEGLYRPGDNLFTTSKIKKFLDDNPDIYNLNVNVERNEGLRKSLEQDHVSHKEN